MGLFTIKCSKLPQQILLFVTKLTWSYNYYFDVLIPLTNTAKFRHPFALQTEIGSCLCAGWYFQLHFFCERRNLNFITKSYLCKCERYFTVNIVTFTFKEIMRLHTNHNV
ncbi:hypothetical protein D3C73_1388200 [compost metagenome]